MSAPTTSERRRAAPRGGATTVLTETVARLLLLPTLVAAVGVLIKGYAQPGDGFAAGVIASLGVLLQHLALGRREAEKLAVVRRAPTITGAGLLLALGVAIAPLLLGDDVLTHYPRPGAEVIYLGTLELITPVLFDVGIFLLVFGFVVGTMNAFARTIYEEEEYAGPQDSPLTEANEE